MERLPPIALLAEDDHEGNNEHNVDDNHDDEESNSDLESLAALVMWWRAKTVREAHLTEETMPWDRSQNSSKQADEPSGKSQKKIVNMRTELTIWTRHVIYFLKKWYKDLK